MTIAKGSAIAGGLMCAMAIGVWTGQRLTRENPADHQAAVTAPAPEAAQAASLKPTHRADGTRAVLTTRPAVPGTVSVSVHEPALHERLAPVLNRGADLDIAGDGFASAEQFAAVAHAARNTGVPFMLLKDRVVAQRKSLSKALGELRPDVNAQVEADRAFAEAQSDLASLAL
jgi:hypothetical protein